MIGLSTNVASSVPLFFVNLNQPSARNSLVFCSNSCIILVRIFVCYEVVIRELNAQLLNEGHIPNINFVNIGYASNMFNDAFIWYIMPSLYS